MDIKPKHRRIYVAERIKQIHQEMKGLKAKNAETPERPSSDAGYNRMHRDFVFNKIRAQELRAELLSLKSEAKSFPKESKCDAVPND